MLSTAFLFLGVLLDRKLPPGEARVQFFQEDLGE
jgi:hypothetical protein